MMTRASLSIACAVLACSGRDGQHAAAQSSHRDSRQHATSTVIPPISDTARHYCARVSGAIRISEDSIGPLDLSKNLSGLHAICPAAHFTVDYGEETSSPAMAFPFEGLTAIAVQHEDSLLSSQPADAWGVSGDSGVLLGKVPLTARWAAFRQAFEPGIASGENISIGQNRITVMFCAHPRILLILHAPPDSVTSDRPADLSRIPADARIKELDIFPRPNPTSHC